MTAPSVGVIARGPTEAEETSDCPRTLSTWLLTVTSLLEIVYPRERPIGAGTLGIHPAR